MTGGQLSKVREMRKFALAVVSIFASFAILTACGSADAASGCGPFGDPPQTLVSNEVPLCVGGTLLGPWNDSDGTARYACLYQPASASASNKLPLLVWLHPSLVTADSIISTNILSFQKTIWKFFQ